MILVCLAMCILLQNPIPSTTKPSNPEQKHPQSSEQQPADDQRSTEQLPLVVKVPPSAQVESESDDQAKNGKDKALTDWWLTFFTGVLALMAILQLGVFGYQGYKLKQTVEAAEGQSSDMKNNIAEAKRAATAMENVAKHFESSVKETIESTKTFSRRGEMQMRAYVCIDVGTAGFQVRPDTKFAAQTIMFNAGPTPAHKVGFRAKADILPVPLPEGFDFPLPKDNVGASILGPHQRMNITRFVEDFVADEDVNDIKFARGKALYIWGIIDYFDVFEVKHSTKFAQMMNWSPSPNGEIVFGTYLSGHNDAD